MAVSAEVGFWWTLSTLRKYRGGQITDRARGGGKAGEKMVEDRKTTDLPPVRE